MWAIEQGETAVRVAVDEELDVAELRRLAAELLAAADRLAAARQ